MSLLLEKKLKKNIYRLYFFLILSVNQIKYQGVIDDIAHFPLFLSYSIFFMKIAIIYMPENLKE